MAGLGRICRLGSTPINAPSRESGRTFWSNAFYLQKSPLFMPAMQSKNDSFRTCCSRSPASGEAMLISAAPMIQREIGPSKPARQSDSISSLPTNSNDIANSNNVCLSSEVEAPMIQWKSRSIYHGFSGNGWYAEYRSHSSISSSSSFVYSLRSEFDTLIQSLTRTRTEAGRGWRNQTSLSLIAVAILTATGGGTVFPIILNCVVLVPSTTKNLESPELWQLLMQ